MWYMNDPIEFTQADGVVVPVRTDGVVVIGSVQDRVASTIPIDGGYTNPYLDLFYREYQHGKVGPTRIPLQYYLPRGVLVGTTVFSLPSISTSKGSIVLSDIARGMVNIVRACREGKIETLAVPWVSREYSEDTMVEVLERIEEGEGEGRVEVWLYTMEML